MCGGTRTSQPMDGSRRGLSPRVRGNRGVGLPLAGVNGSIPACAGEPPGYAAALLAKQVYPRVCGGTRLKSALDR